MLICLLRPQRVRGEVSAPVKQKGNCRNAAEVSLSCRVNRGRRKHGGTNSGRLSAAGEFTGLEGEGARTSLMARRLRVVVRLLHS